MTRLGGVDLITEKKRKKIQSAIDVLLGFIYRVCVCVWGWGGGGGGGDELDK